MSARRLKIASVANNYGKSHDGVGAYAGVQGEELSKYADVSVYTSECRYEESKLRKFFCMGMTKQLFKVTRDCKNYDVVLIDYLFVEWNPLILLPIIILNRSRKKNGCKLVISLHEYNRVNSLRKKMIKTICKKADMVFVADDTLKKSIQGFCKKIVIRPIPSNVFNESIIESNVPKDKNVFVYFGLINKAKAFDEMIDAWDLFNEDGNKQLIVISGSSIQGLEKHKNVAYRYNLTDNEILKIMMKCAASIVPVIPEVDMKNTTFKTSCITGCVSIGKFCEDYRKLKFVIPMEEYNVQDFVDAFSKVDQFSDKRINILSDEARAYGKIYTPPNVAKKLLNAIEALGNDKE